MKEYKFCKGIILFILISMLTACVTPQPNNPHNVCAIFEQYPNWHQVTEHTADRWGLPVHVQMAMMYYESAFVGDARPRRRQVLGLIPGAPLSSAYGYSQAIDGTWHIYQMSTNRFSAQRTSFADASDFMGWYSDQIHQNLGIKPTDAYHLYLAYHEGIDEYRLGSYLHQHWLMNYAKRVASRAEVYRAQLGLCGYLGKMA